MSLKENIKRIIVKIGNDSSSEIQYRDLYKSLITMIKWTRQFNKSPQIEKIVKNSIISPLMWAKEYCTIKFSLPRQSGHTRMLKEIVGKIGPTTPETNLFKKVLVFFPNSTIATNHGFNPSWNWVLTPNSLKSNKFKGIDLDGIIIDCSSVLSKQQIENIYQIFKGYTMRNPHFIFIFLE